MTVTYKRTDGNQSDIVDALRDVGATVEILSSVGKDFPDVIVGFRGVNYLFEIKMPEGKLSDGQIEWHHSWQGQAAVVRNRDEVLWEIGAIERIDNA